MLQPSLNQKIGTGNPESLRDSNGDRALSVGTAASAVGKAPAAEVASWEDPVEMEGFLRKHLKTLNRALSIAMFEYRTLKMDTQSEIQVGGKINFEAPHPFCLESSGLICMDDFVLEYIYTVEERPGSEWVSCNQDW